MVTLSEEILSGRFNFLCSETEVSHVPERCIYKFHDNGQIDQNVKVRSNGEKKLFRKILNKLEAEFFVREKKINFRKWPEKMYICKNE